MPQLATIGRKKCAGFLPAKLRCYSLFINTPCFSGVFNGSGTLVTASAVCGCPTTAEVVLTQPGGRKKVAQRFIAGFPAKMGTSPARDDRTCMLYPCSSVSIGGEFYRTLYFLWFACRMDGHCQQSGGCSNNWPKLVRTC